MLAVHRHIKVNPEDVLTSSSATRARRGGVRVYTPATAPPSRTDHGLFLTDIGHHPASVPCSVPDSAGTRPEKALHSVTEHETGRITYGPTTTEHCGHGFESSSSQCRGKPVLLPQCDEANLVR